MLLEGNEIASGSLWAAEDSEAVVRRVWYAQPVVGAMLSVGAILIGQPADAAGVVFGSALAMLNFRYLERSLRSILVAGHPTAPPGTTMMFVFRWIIVGTIAFAIHATGIASLVGVVVGMFAPAGAVAFEAVFQTVHEFRSGHAGHDNATR